MLVLMRRQNRNKGHDGSERTPGCDTQLADRPIQRASHMSAGPFFMRSRHWLWTRPGALGERVARIPSRAAQQSM